MSNSPIVLPVNPNQYQNIVNNIPQNISQNIPTQNYQTIDPELYKQAINNIQNAIQQTQNFPTTQQYKPSKLRTILGDASGVFSGITSLNPVKGEAVANTIKQYPYNLAVQRYQSQMIPAMQRAQLGLQEAQVASGANKNIFDLINALAHQRSSNASMINANRPRVSRAYNIIPPGDTQAHTYQSIESIDPNNPGSWTNKSNDLGISPVETPEERQQKQNQTFQNQKTLAAIKQRDNLILETKRNIAENLRAGLTRQQSENKAIADLKAKRIEFDNNKETPWNAISVSERNGIDKEILQEYPEFSKIIKVNGVQMYVLKSAQDLSPADQQKLQFIRNHIAIQQISVHNHSIDDALHQLQVAPNTFSIENTEEPSDVQ